MSAKKDLVKLVRKLKSRIFGVFRTADRATKFESTWEGLYSHLSEVPVPVGSSYNDDRRVLEMLEQAREIRSQIERGEKPWFWHEALVTLAALRLYQKGCLRVVDFGGGLATGFLHLVSSLPDIKGVEYEVVELDKMRAAGDEFYSGEPRVRYFDSLGLIKPKPDILYINSVLQYIEDYSTQLRRFAETGADCILMGRAAIADIPTFATRQVNLPGQVLPYWFLNKNEVVTIMADAGYSLVLDDPWGKYYDQSNFPATHRIGRMRNLLFARTK